MKIRAEIHKRKIYLSPRPKKDMPGALILMLNKPRAKGKEPFLQADIEAYRKEYELPELPEGIWIINCFVKNEIKINGGKDKN